MKGAQLEFLPSEVMKLSKWRTLHPNTLVLDGRAVKGFMGAFDIEKKPELFAWSLGSGKKAKLYPQSRIANAVIINDRFDDRNVVVFYDAAARTAYAWVRGERTFRRDGISGRLFDDSGSEWDLRSGRPADSPDAKPLGRLPITAWLSERWRGFYPGAPVFGE